MFDLCRRAVPARDQRRLDLALDCTFAAFRASQEQSKRSKSRKKASGFPSTASEMPVGPGVFVSVWLGFGLAWLGSAAAA